MKSKKWGKIVNNLAKASYEKDEAIKGIKIGAVITEALQEIGVEPILVGGAAVTFYTNGEYTTQDIDMIAPAGPEMDEVMNKLGFSRLGKDYINRGLNIYLEFPSDSLGPTENYDIIKVDNVDLKIISIEDLIIDRLAAFKFWKSGIDGVNTLRMLELGKGDRKRIEERAREEDVLDALDYVEDVLETSIRKKLSPREASKLLEKYLR